MREREYKNRQRKVLYYYRKREKEREGEREREVKGAKNQKGTTLCGETPGKSRGELKRWTRGRVKRVDQRPCEGD